MNSFVKSSLIFIGGFASGVAAAYFAATHFLEIEFIDNDQEDDKQEETSTDEPAEIEKVEEPAKEVNTETSQADPFGETYKGIEGNDHYVDYTRLLETVKYNTDPESDDIYDNVIPDDVDIFGDPIQDPVIVNGNEFGQDLDYDEITLRYYEKQALLTDDWDEVVENIEDTVGVEAMEKLREGDSDAVYVKNDRLKAYYEIVCHAEDYPGISG